MASNAGLSAILVRLRTWRVARHVTSSIHGGASGGVTAEEYVSLLNWKAIAIRDYSSLYAVRRRRRWVEASYTTPWSVTNYEGDDFYDMMETTCSICVKMVQNISWRKT